MYRQEMTSNNILSIITTKNLNDQYISFWLIFKNVVRNSNLSLSNFLGPKSLDNYLGKADPVCMFEKFDSITLLLYSTCNVSNMYFILSSHYKSIGYVWMGIKTIFRPQKLYRAGTAPPGSSIPWSATALPYQRTSLIS